MRNNQQMNQGGNRMIVGGGEGTFVDGADLKPVDASVETLVGFANGAFNGAVVSAAISALFSLKDGGKNSLMENWGKNLSGSHLTPVLIGTALSGVVGAVIRNSRARMHNQWRNEHYQFLEHQEQQGAQGSFAGREDARRSQTASAVNER